jgi:transposase
VPDHSPQPTGHATDGLRCTSSSRGRARPAGSGGEQVRSRRDQPRLVVADVADRGADLFTFLRQPVLDATNWRAELAIRFGVIPRKLRGGSRTWAGARAQAVLMSVWRTCWQQGRCALDFLSQLLRGMPVALALPP